MNNDFEIHAPRISEEELESIIRRRLAGRQLDPAEIDRVENLNFSPLSATGMKGFDPAETADLFERSATVPGFRSGKFRWLKGPLAWAARRVYRMCSLLMDKLSEHKIEAFYNVIGELIFLRRRVTDLQNRLVAVNTQESSVFDPGWSNIPGARDLDQSDPIALACQEMLSLLEKNSIQAPISVVDDAGGYMTLVARERGLEVDSVGSMDLIFQDSYYLRPGSVVVIPSFQNLRSSPAYLVSALRRFAGPNSYLLIGADQVSTDYIRGLQRLCGDRGYNLLDEQSDEMIRAMLFKRS